MACGVTTVDVSSSIKNDVDVVEVAGGELGISCGLSSSSSLMSKSGRGDVGSGSWNKASTAGSSSGNGRTKESGEPGADAGKVLGIGLAMVLNVSIVSGMDVCNCGTSQSWVLPSLCTRRMDVGVSRTELTRKVFLRCMATWKRAAVSSAALVILMLEWLFVGVLLQWVWFDVDNRRGEVLF